MSKEPDPIDWKAVEREDGTVFLTSGDPNNPKSRHIAFDVSCSFKLAQEFAEAKNFMETFWVE